MLIQLKWVLTIAWRGPVLDVCCSASMFSYLHVWFFLSLPSPFPRPIIPQRQHPLSSSPVSAPTRNPPSHFLSRQKRTLTSLGLTEKSVLRHQREEDLRNSSCRTSKEEEKEASGLGSREEGGGRAVGRSTRAYISIKFDADLRTRHLCSKTQKTKTKTRKNPRSGAASVNGPVRMVV